LRAARWVRWIQKTAKEDLMSDVQTDFDAAQQTLMSAIAAQQAGDEAGAEALFLQVHRQWPGHPAAAYSLGVIALKKNDSDTARHWVRLGLEAAPSYAPLHFLAGAAVRASGGDADVVVQFYDKAAELQPDYLEAMINAGVVLRDALRHREALERFERALAIRPDYQTALVNAGILLTEFKRNEQAIALFERLLATDPNYEYGLGLLLFEKLHIADWTDYAPMKARVLEANRAGKRSCKSLAMMAFCDDYREHQQAARTFAAHLYPTHPQPLWRRVDAGRYQHERIRLAYISPDLREHPVGHLIAGVIEQHDKTRFETHAISVGIEDGSRIRARMRASFDHFHDMQRFNAHQIARLIRDLEIDILVDLGAYTADARPDVLALRPAPVQVNYLGYCGTMGVAHVDYLIADRTVIPPEHWDGYDEKIVYLPDSYLPTDGSIVIPQPGPRSDYGLPESGVVFCAFNHDFKISPDLFAIWLRLLHKTPGSVLWLMSRHPLSQRNLCAYAQSAGIDPARLVFAKRVPKVEDHLARYRVADIFLDTFPYNAHTTAADALMAGCPLVTCMGNAFPSRVAGSLLHQVGLDELATHSLADYETLATALAADPERRAHLRERLTAARTTSPLFDTKRYTRNLESAFVAMWRKQQLTVADGL
jgi:protein O-GlcNAc transferase